jgi:hypothetical protein
MHLHSILPASVLLLVAFVMCPAPSDAHGRCRDCCPPPPPIPVILKVCHPCTGCEYEVKVCIPACCTDIPCVSHHHTIIGDGKTVFEWKSGHKVVVRFPSGGGYRVIQRGEKV